MFPRPKYLNAIKPFMNTDLIKVVTGIRRCGKSTLLDLIKQQLELDGVDPARLISFKMESMEFDGISNYRELYQVIRKKIEGIEKPYLFFDELQNVDGWEKAINSLRVDLPCDIYITGSNAFLLSSEISTLISGRYVEIPMQTLTFSEYLLFREANWTPNGDQSSDIAILPDGSFQTLRRLFNDYLQYGGFPYLSQMNPDREVCSAYTRDLVQTIITRDILTREGRRGRRLISDRRLLERLCAYLSDNVGNRTSINKIVGSLNENGLSTSNKTVDAYISALTEAYLFDNVQRFDIKGRAILATGGKYYIADTGIRSYLDGYRSTDSGRMLENIVYNQLLFDAYTVHVGQLRAGEVDFVADNKQGKRVYIQVTESLAAEATRERELDPLRKIPDEHTKVVLTMDESIPTNINGIRIVNIIDFLLGRELL